MSRDEIIKYLYDNHARADVSIEDIADVLTQTGAWVIKTRHEHYPSGKEYETLMCPFCGRTDHNGDGSYCGYCGAKLSTD